MAKPAKSLAAFVVGIVVIAPTEIALTGFAAISRILVVPALGLKFYENTKLTKVEENSNLNLTYFIELKNELSSTFVNFVFS